MNNGDQVTSESDDFTFQDVLRFFEAKAVNSQCPVCTENEWEMQYVRLTDQPDRVFGAYGLAIGLPFSFNKSQGQRQTVQPGPFARPILPLVCKNCGYMRVHDYASVAAWVKENPTDATKA